MTNRISKKERNLIINSQVIEDHMWLKELLDTQLSLAIDQVKEENKSDFQYVVPYILKQCGEEWKGDESVLHPIEDLGDGRRPCGLCGRDNRYIYYIQNRLNGNKLNVGGDCVEDFVDMDLLREGNSKGQLLRKAKELRRRGLINQRFPGIQSRIDTWLNRVARYETILPTYLEEPYLAEGTKLQELHNSYLRNDEDESILDEVEEILNKETDHIRDFDNYQLLNLDNPFIVTKKIMTWLENRRDRKTIEILKEVGYISHETVSFIWEGSFIEKNKEAIKALFGNTQFDLVDIDYDNEGFILKKEPSQITLILKFEKFFTNFGGRIKGGTTRAAFSDSNISKLCVLSGDNSPYIFKDELEFLLEEWDIGIDATDDEISYNQAYLLDRKSKLYVQVSFNELVMEAKGLVFGLDNFDKRKFEEFVQRKEGKRITEIELSENREISGQMASKSFR